MNATILTIFTFIAALSIGILIGKLLFSAKSQSEKNVLEERSIALQSQLDSLRQQMSNDRQSFEKQLQVLNLEKENIRAEKDSLAIQLTKSEVDFENLPERVKIVKQ